MGLSVRLDLGDKPKIHVEGQVIQTLRRDQLSDLLHGEGDLRKRVQALHGGRGVDGFHLSDDDQMPHNLRGTFAKYRWQPATVTHRAQGARILEVTSDPVIVGDAEAENPSSLDDVEAQYSISETVTNSVERVAQWNVSSTVTQEVHYEVGGDAAGGKVGGSTSLSFTAGYGESTGKTESVEVGSQGTGTVTLDSGQRILIKLSASRGQIRAQVDYRQALSGGVFYHYKKKVDGHYLWYAPLTKLYSRKELQQIHTEILKVKVYSHMKIRFEDP